MKDTTVAARYAKALFITSEKRSETTRVLEEIKGLGDAIAAGTPAGKLLATPQLRLSDKRDALKKGLDGKVLPLAVVFLDLLLRKKRLTELDTIVNEYEALVERSQGLQRANLVSAVPFTDQETQRVQAALEQMTKKTIRLTTEVDASLLGGALVRIGDRVVDRSVKSLMETIEQRLSEVSV